MLQDLAHTRDDVRNEVFKAPMRRIDNIITRLTGERMDGVNERFTVIIVLLLNHEVYAAMRNEFNV